MTTSRAYKIFRYRNKNTGNYVSDKYTIFADTLDKAIQFADGMEYAGWPPDVYQFYNYELVEVNKEEYLKLYPIAHSI